MFQSGKRIVVGGAGSPRRAMLECDDSIGRGEDVVGTAGFYRESDDTLQSDFVFVWPGLQAR